MGKSWDMGNNGYIGEYIGNPKEMGYMGVSMAMEVPQNGWFISGKIPSIMNEN